MPTRSNPYARLVAAARKGRIHRRAAEEVRTLVSRLRERTLTRLLSSGTTVDTAGDVTSELSAKLAEAFHLACLSQSKLTSQIRAIEGMSGQRYRSLINNLIGSLPDARYLEVGSWRGSTAASAIFGNACRCVCIDNWEEFGGPKQEFQMNIAQAASADCNFTFVESDFRAVDYARLGRFNVYLFDGPHRYVDQYDGVILAQPALEDEYVLIVDDWNWRQVRNGTLAAIDALGSQILYSIQVRTTHNEGHPEVSRGESDWHNGYFIGVVCKLGERDGSGVKTRGDAPPEADARFPPSSVN